MDEQERARALILESRRAAAGHIAAIKAAPAPTRELVRREVRGYIMAKFHLTEDDCATESFRDLAGLSLSKSMRLSPELVKEYDLARSCDGTSSRTAKMVLLFLALQRDLGIRFDPMSTAEAETLTDVGDLVWEQLKKQSQNETV